MAVIGVLLLIVFVVSALLLIVIVLMQDDQGEGLGGIFGGGSSTAFGSRSGNILTKTTSILGAVFIISTFGLAWVNRTPEAGDVLGVARETSTEATEEWWNQPVNTDIAEPSDTQTGE